MRKSRKWLLSIIGIPLFLSCIVGCQRKDEDKLPVYDLVSLLNKPESIPLSSIFQSIKEVQLETTEEALIGYISKLIVTDDLIFIVHGTRCSVFDHTGKYIRDISKVGEGPGEYARLSTVFIKDDMIGIYDRPQKSIICFTFNGEFVKKIKVPESLGYAYPLDGNDYLGYIENRTGREKNKLIFFDETTKIDSVPYLTEYKNQGMITVFLHEGFLFNINNTYSFKELFNDTIYYINQYDIQPRFVLEMGEYNATQEYRHSLTDPNKNFFEEKIWIMPIGETKDYLFINGIMDNKTSSFYLDKKQNTLRNVELTFPEGMDYEGFFVPAAVSEDKRSVIATIESEEGDENPTLIIATL